MFLVTGKPLHIEGLVIEGKKYFLDEGIHLFPEPSEETKEYMKKIRILTNQHLLNEDKTDLKHSAIVEQSITYFQR